MFNTFNIKYSKFCTFLGPCLNLSKFEILTMLTVVYKMSDLPRALFFIEVHVQTTL